MIIRMSASASNEPPQQLRDDPEWSQRKFYSLPKELLASVIDAVGEARFDDKLLKLENAVSSACGDHSSIIGFDREQPITFRYLRQPLSVSAFIAEAISSGMANEKGMEWLKNFPARLAGTFDRRLGWAWGIARAYAGWLGLNVAFIRDQEMILSLRSSTIALERLQPLVASESNDSRVAISAFMTARQAFMERWHLAEMADEFLVVPAMPRIGLGDVTLAAQAAVAEHGTHIFLPTVFPVPDRDELRSMIEDAVPREELADHLADWRELVSGNSQGKQRLTRLARIFEFQHWWHVLHSRHSSALAGRRNAVLKVFANWFDFDTENSPSNSVGIDVLRRDLTELRSARGSGWERAPITG